MLFPRSLPPKLTHLFLLLGISCFSAFATERTVSKTSSADFTTLQAGVNASHAGDTLTILDTATYEEQVTLPASLHHFTLHSSFPSSLSKPRIRWLDGENIGPKNCQEAQDTSKITYLRNGALRLLGARFVRIQGIAIDGGGQTPFAYSQVWGNGVDCSGPLNPLFHGNVGVVVINSANIQILDCEIANAFFGLYLRNAEVSGPFAFGEYPVRLAPLSSLAQGNHLIASNAVHHNAFGFFIESTSGLGSTFRDNRIYQNHHADENVSKVKSLLDGQNYPGGAFLFKNAAFSSMAIHNNTFHENSHLLIGNYRPGSQYLLANNCFGRPYHYDNDPAAPFPNSFQEMLPLFQKRSKHNLLAAQWGKPPRDSVSMRVQRYDEGKQQVLIADSVVHLFRAVRILNGMPTPDLDSPMVKFILPFLAGPQEILEKGPLGFYPGASITGRGQTGSSISSDANNRWLETDFVSVNSRDADFLKPIREQLPFFSKQGWAEFGYMTTSGDTASIGALSASERSSGSLHIIPLTPVLPENGKWTLNFIVKGWDGPLANLRIIYLRAIRGLSPNTLGFGGVSIGITPAASLIPQPGSPIEMGFNSLQVSAPFAESDSVGFVEMAIQARNASGQWVFSNVATLPLIPLESPFDVQVWQANKDSAVTEWEAGQTVRIRVSDKAPLLRDTAIALGLVSGGNLEILDTLPRDRNGLFLSPRPFIVRARVADFPEGGVELVYASALPYERSYKNRYSVSGPIRSKSTTTKVGAKLSKREGSRFSRKGNERHPRNVLGRLPSPYSSTPR